MGRAVGIAMTDHDGSPPLNHRPRRATQQPDFSERDSAPSKTHGKGGPNTDDIFSSASTAAADASLSPDTPDAPFLRSSRPENPKGPHRTQTKHRSNGAFLLSDPVTISHGRDRSSRTLPQSRHHDAVHTNTRGRDGLPPLVSHPSGTQGVGLGLERTRPSQRMSSGSAVTKGESLAGDTAVGSGSPLDVDSAQIVKMALNLSESRRLASRRNVSSPIPPKLAPLPDTPTSGSLRQHLQQQRRVSRTISPKPDRSPRIGSPRILSPLQSTFEPEGSYRYHFSQSTLARAQKAKDYLELMAQYRRVLDLLPPLKPSRTARSSTTSPPGSPNGSVQAFKTLTNELDPNASRAYDPLQYIRNRKVRARERKVIDGERQGFSDVMRVSEWADEVSRWVATGQAHAPGRPTLPPYETADAIVAQDSPLATNSRPGAAPAKPTRPRVDWVINPADMLADVYWLEQDDNKRLVEDRHWRRVFPQETDLYQPLSHEEPEIRIDNPNSNKEPPEIQALSEKHSSDYLIKKVEHEHVLSTARDRAQQKLRALRNAHHRQNSLHGRDFLRIHRGSMSESSDTDNDFRRRGRAGTITSGGKAILAKQMDAMIAQEQKDAESHPLYDHEALRMKFNHGLMTPDRERPHISPIPSRTNSQRRGESRAELSETENKPVKLKTLPSSPQGAGRASLEVPQRGRRFSVDYDTSQPNSPDLRPLHDGTLVPAIGSDFSPMSSRPGSPTRNPLTKVRSIFRERSKDRSADIYSPIAEGTVEFTMPSVPIERVESPGSDWTALSSEWTQSKNPPRKVTTGGSHGNHRSHKSISSLKLRGEDGVGLRSLFRGPRIDSVLRSSVSKVSDMIWRKESGSAGDEQFSGTSSDESDMDLAKRGRPRGRSKGSALPSRTGSQRRDGELTSQFLSPPGQLSLSAPGSYPASRPLSPRSSRFELLKPPRIDVQSASPMSTSPPPELAHPQLLDVSETESRKSSYASGVRAADSRLNAVLALPKPPQLSPTMSSRHWAVTDRHGVPLRARISKAEVARLRAILLSYGIQAMETERCARERSLLTSVRDHSALVDGAAASTPESGTARFPWADVARLCPDPEVRDHLFAHPIAQTEIYPLAGRILGASIQASAQQWQATSSTFATETAPALEHRVETLRSKVAGELAGMTQAATDEADEANHDLVVGQRLKVKKVMDGMDKMLRRRRRRFRWVRRAGWLAVEWALVGFMWYVWFVVMIARVVLGVGKGVTRAVRWLLWL
ncbi:hypothetical protein B0T16DRAFT_402431 [Cercophora newfieldiana]|uniref:Uncharacterized protein n=1 Tax=Cercophora newfieldiana TaxID=92897 RepID=A0AA40D2D8_9PEZI|nr:hypothetical protein B0T16DRAFT_402431 [Cercophora newfieldiana]